jgi:mRNA interferase HigB
MFNIIARKTLNDFGENYPEAKTALQKLYHELLVSEFRNFNELKEVYKSASILNDNRVVFNICGNKYRLVVRINFQFKAIQIKWFGTHKEYDLIEAENVPFKKK